jgi:hypothetical protein
VDEATMIKQQSKNLRINCCILKWPATSPWKSTIFTGGRRFNIMPEARSESNSESNKKNWYTL